MGLGPLGIVQFLQRSGIPIILYFMDNVFSLVSRNSPVYNNYVSIFGPPRFDIATRIIAMSRNVLEQVGVTLGTTFEDVLYIPGWIHLKNAAEPVFNSGGETRFVVCSRVAPHKGTDIVLDATEELARLAVTGFSIDVYGAGEVGPFLQKVQSKGLSRYIRYLGCKPKQEMQALFGNYDALLFPTWEREPFGFTVSEAAAAGCFSIMTSGIGASEWFVDDVDCMKIPRTSDALLTAMYRTIRMPPEDRQRFRVSAMQSARRYLTADRWIDRIELECLSMGKKKARNNCDASLGVESAFLFLCHMWKNSLGIPAAWM
jgi:glycogen(starch) synthase